MKPQELFGRQCWIEVRFPEQGLERSNMNVLVAVDDKRPFAQLELQIRFDGVEAALMGWHVTRPETKNLTTKSILESEAAQLGQLGKELDEKGVDELLTLGLRRFRFSELGVYNHNAANFFPEGWVGVTLLEYPHAPVLMATPQ